MFIISHVALSKSGLCNPRSIPSYSVAVGLVFYAVMYMYILYNHSEYAGVFNKFVIYIVGVDLLLSAFYHFSSNQDTNPAPTIDNEEDDDDEDTTEESTEESGQEEQVDELVEQQVEQQVDDQVEQQVEELVEQQVEEQVIEQVEEQVVEQQLGEQQVDERVVDELLIKRKRGRPRKSEPSSISLASV